MHQLGVPCSGCRRLLRLPVDVVGKSVRCPLCQADFLAADDGKGGAVAVPMAKVAAPSVRPVEPVADLPVAQSAPPSVPNRLRPVRFVVFVQKDPADKLRGRFEAEVDADGLRIWRGSGRILSVRRGSACRRLRGSRIAVELEGRMVEMTVIADCGADLLAEQVEAFLKGTTDKVETREANPWPVAPIYLLPLGVPLLAALFGDNIASVLGIVMWSLLALALLGIGLPFAFRRRWSGKRRGLLALLLAFVGYAVLGIGFLVDRAMGPGRVPASAWKSFDRPDLGFAAQFPGEPKVQSADHPDFKPGSAFSRVIRLDRPSIRITVLTAEFSDLPEEGLLTRLEQGAKHILSDDAGGGGRGTANRLPAPAVGVEATEYLKDGPGGSWGRTRLYVSRGRLLAVSISSSRPDKNHPDLVRFWDNFRFVPFPDRLPNGIRDLGPGRLGLSWTDEGYAWVGYRPDGRIVAMSRRGQVIEWSADFTRREIVAMAWIFKDEPPSLSPDGRFLAVPETPATPMRVHDLTGKHRAMGWGDDKVGAVGARVAFSPDGKELLQTGREPAYFRDGGPRRAVEGMGGGGAAAFHPDGSMFAVAGPDGAIRLHDRKKGTVKHRLFGHPNNQPPLLLQWRRDGERLLSCGSDSTVRVWDATGGLELRSIEHPGAVAAAAWNPAGRLIATGCSDGFVRLFDAETGEERGSLGLGNEAVPAVGITSLVFSPDGLFLAVAVGRGVEHLEVARIIRPAR